MFNYCHRSCMFHCSYRICCFVCFSPLCLYISYRSYHQSFEIDDSSRRNSIDGTNVSTFEARTLYDGIVGGKDEVIDR